MPLDVPAYPTESRLKAEALLRPLLRRYWAALICVATLVLLDQAVLQPLLVQLNFSAPAINLAGRQRMLSQKITKEALAWQLATDQASREAHQSQLATALDQWTSAHEALIEGDVDRKIQPASGAVALALDDLTPSFTAIQIAAQELLAANDSTASSDSADGTAAVTRLLELEPGYLIGMERVVAMLESAALQRVSWLRRCGLIAMLSILLLLGAVYWFVLSPATRMIRRQVEQLAYSDHRHQQLAEMLRQARDSLEDRVRQRTNELRATATALEQEMARRQEIEQRNRALSTELAHASRVNALGQFARGLAHEINQPLATVTNYAGTLEMALQDATAPEAGNWREFVSQIKQAALRAGGIVRGMRNFVRHGKVVASMQDIHHLILEVQELCIPELRRATIELTSSVPGEPAWAMVDPVQIQQVLVNLVHNSAQAIEAADTGDRRVWIESQLTSDEITISVKDTGPGLPEKIKQHCFEPFHSSKHDGLGLGLAISKTLIEQHQGRIWSEPLTTGGAVIHFCLPRHCTHDRPTEQHAHGICS